MKSKNQAEPEAVTRRGSHRYDFHHFLLEDSPAPVCSQGKGLGPHLCLLKGSVSENSQTPFKTTSDQTGSLSRPDGPRTSFPRPRRTGRSPLTQNAQQSKPIWQTATGPVGCVRMGGQVQKTVERFCVLTGLVVKTD